LYTHITPHAASCRADGKPVTAQALADATGRSPDEVADNFERARSAGAEFEDGALAGSALSLRPTRHHFRVRGNDLYTWCGFDALFLPIILGEQAEVSSSCPVTQAEIRLTVEADGTVSAANPGTVVVGIVGNEVTSCCDVSGPDSAVCTQMPFYVSREAGERWLPEHPGVALADLGEAQDVARAYVSSGCC